MNLILNRVVSMLESKSLCCKNHLKILLKWGEENTTHLFILLKTILWIWGLALAGEVNLTKQKTKTSLSECHQIMQQKLDNFPYQHTDTHNSPTGTTGPNAELQTCHLHVQSFQQLSTRNRIYTNEFPGSNTSTSSQDRIMTQEKTYF